MVNGITVKVIKKNMSSAKMIAGGIISEQDAEMDKRVRTAVSIAKKEAKVRNKPIAVYDKIEKKAYLIDAFGKRIDCV